MAEIGTVASAITLVQIAAQLWKFGRDIISAPGEWERYCTSLENLGHTHGVVSEVIKNLNLPTNLTVKVGNEPESLITFCNNRLDMVRKQGIELLKKFKENTTRKSKIKKLLEKLRKDTSKRLHYVLMADQVQSLVQNVEHEKSCLLLALSVAILAANGQEHQATQDKIKDLTEQMLTQFEALTTAQYENRLILDKIPVTLSDHIEPDQYHTVSVNLKDGRVPSSVENDIVPDSQLQTNLPVTYHSSSVSDMVENKDNSAAGMPEGSKNGDEDPEDQPSLKTIKTNERKEDHSLIQPSAIMKSGGAIIEQLRNDRNLQFSESDLQEIQDYLANQEDMSVSDETSVSEETKILDISARSVFTTQLVRHLCRSEVIEGYEFCVKAIVLQDDKNILHFREHCSQPCDHITVYSNDDFDSLEDGKEFYLQEIKFSDDEQTSSSGDGDSDTDDSGANGADVDEVEIGQSDAGESDESGATVDSISLFDIETDRSDAGESVESEIELYTLSPCDNDCSHTSVIIGKNGTFACATNGPFSYCIGRILKRTSLSSQPCVFCFEEAEKPMTSLASTEGMWFFYKRKYRYKCLRCGKDTTITG